MPELMLAVSISRLMSRLDLSALSGVPLEQRLKPFMSLSLATATLLPSGPPSGLAGI